jgi:hypothetical protein
LCCLKRRSECHENVWASQFSYNWCIKAFKNFPRSEFWIWRKTTKLKFHAQYSSMKEHICVFQKLYTWYAKGKWLSFHRLLIFTIISEKYEKSILVFTDRSQSTNETGYGVYVSGVLQVVSRLHEPSSVFTAEINALLDAWRTFHLVWQFLLDWSLKVPKKMSEDALLWLRSYVNPWSYRNPRE